MLDINEIQKISMDCSMTEFVGTTVLDTIGLVIPGVNDALLQQMQIDKPYKSLGLWHRILFCTESRICSF